jgi:hypothetical protein
VHAFGANGQRHVYPVIDDQRDAEGGQYFFYPEGPLNESRRIQVFLPQLNHSGAPFGCQPDHLFHRAAQAGFIVSN